MTMRPHMAAAALAHLDHIDDLGLVADALPNSLRIGKSLLVKGNSFEVMQRLPESSIHGIVTDPPYGVKEYESDQIEKMKTGNGGIWRIPPSFDGHVRAPLPRFTALNREERKTLTGFFQNWSRESLRVLKPGGHVFLAANAFVSQLVYQAIVDGGLEFRGELIRLVRTLRGGDRPKNAEDEFPGVCSLPRGCYEPWGVFRKPMPTGMTVSDCLRIHKTGGLRRLADERPFMDVIHSERTPKAERRVANHPSIKPQSFMRRLTRAILPLGEGVILDPFMGSGSTLAAANNQGVHSVGIEMSDEYFLLASKGVDQLSWMECNLDSELASSMQGSIFDGDA